jgi:hypothetical protein
MAKARGQHGLIGSALGDVDATHCNFDLPERWRGLRLRMILRRELDARPVDSRGLN